MTRIGLMLLFATTLAGCATLRPYQAPQVAPAQLANVDPQLVSSQPFDARWWNQFEDPILDALIDRALTANHDVRIAVARLDQARAFFDETSLDRFPHVPVNASAERRRQQVPGFTDEPQTINTYRLGFDAFWEIDLFGRVRSAVNAAAANAESFDATLDDVRVTVAAEVARNYFELRGYQQQEAVATRSLENQRETLRLTTVRRDAGIGEEQDVASAAARVSAIESVLPPIRAAVAARAHRLAVLSGTRPGALQVDLSPRAYPVLAKVLAIGPPDEILRRRPDVRAAERSLAAAVGREGVAAADLYPRVTVTGFLGFLAGRGNIFGGGDSAAWSITPALSWAGLDLGSARARLRGAEALTVEAAVRYEQTVLLALEDVQNALARYREQQRRLVSLLEQAREGRRAADIARVRYREGIIDFLSLLDAERTQLQAEEAVAHAEAEVFTGVAAVYKGLGGVVER
ncbi:MAG TPA: efflux transporter outer membrane subunit [Thermoanaerobaculia bacterium]|nr:efflux transporter outer membrane subunit [Thermoanaerobaculia bacterium]